MPLFYMHLRDDSGDVLDDQGIELPTVAAAQFAAIEAARDIMAFDVRLGVLDMTLSIDVEDEAGQPICKLAFEAALKIKRLT